MENFYQFLQQCPEAVIMVKVGDLLEANKMLISETKQEMEQAIADEKAETYLLQAEVCQLLNVARSTLWRWKKTGYLLPVAVGGQMRYKRSDVNKLLKS